MKKTEKSNQFRFNRLQGLSVGFGVDPAKEEDLDVSDQDKLAFSQYHLPDLGLHNILYPSTCRLYNSGYGPNM